MLFAVILSLQAKTALQTPSAHAIASKVQAAYDAVRTLDVEVNGSIGTHKGSAHISFQRPGKLRVNGQTMFDSPYDLLSAGGSTQFQMNGKWSKCESAEMGIAGITGISANAGTMVPSMLIHAQFGGFAPTAATVALSKGQIVISEKSPFSERVWIDPKTFMITRTETTIGGQVITVVMTHYVINKSIAPGRFAK